VTLRNDRADGTHFSNHITTAPVGSGDDKRMAGFQEIVARIDQPLMPAEPPTDAAYPAYCCGIASVVEPRPQLMRLT